MEQGASQDTLGYFQLCFQIFQTFTIFTPRHEADLNLKEAQAAWVLHSGGHSHEMVDLNTLCQGCCPSEGNRSKGTKSLGSLFSPGFFFEYLDGLDMFWQSLVLDVNNMWGIGHIFFAKRGRPTQYFPLGLERT